MKYFFSILILTFCLNSFFETMSTEEPFRVEIGRVVEMSISIGGTVLDNRIQIGLFDEITPITSDNFYQLCVNGFYNGAPFHRIIPGFMIQGGDFTNRDGTGGSAFKRNFNGRDRFDDENFHVRHRPFAVAMANFGPNSNGSQFYIPVSETGWLDGTSTVFGRVESGSDVVKEIESYGSPSGNPYLDIEIVECVSSLDPNQRSDEDYREPVQEERPPVEEERPPTEEEYFKSLKIARNKQVTVIPSNRNGFIQVIYSN